MTKSKKSLERYNQTKMKLKTKREKMGKKTVATFRNLKGKMGQDTKQKTKKKTRIVRERKCRVVPQNQRQKGGTL